LSAALYLRSETGRWFVIGKGLIAPGVESGQFTEAWAVRPPPSVPAGKYQGFLLVSEPFESPPSTELPHFQRVRFDLGEFTLK
jgi:hypothetical protein